MRTIILILTMVFSLSASAVSVYNADTTKAEKLARKALKLMKSDKAKDIEKGFTMYEQAADMGLMSAQRYMASYYYDKGDVNDALRWWERLAQEGDADVQYALGTEYLGYGKGENPIYEKDDAKGVAYMKMAAEQGHTKAQAVYGACLMEGTGIEKNAGEGFRWLKKAADAGDAFAQCKIGVCYCEGKGCEVDHKKAFGYYLLAAKQGFPESQYNLARCYHFGEGTAKDLDEAIYWYSKALEQGVVDAKNNLALVLEEKNGNSDETLFLLRKGAEAGDATAQYNLGTRYAQGKGVTQDYTMAAHWYMKAANGNCVSAQAQLGVAYLNGQGVDIDYDKAFYWSSKAAEQKDTVALNSLGVCYEQGYGVEKDEIKAFKLYNEAVDLGFNFALVNVARCYSFGIGVEQSYSKAFEWYKKAADKGVVETYDVLGYMYQEGQGTVKNLDKAIFYYEKALTVATDDKDKGEICFNIGLAYRKNNKDSKAAEYMQKSTDYGEIVATLFLAIYYHDGIGVPVNIEKCKQLLRKCAAQNENIEVREEAKKYLQELK